MKISQKARKDFEFYKNSSLDMIGYLVGEELPECDPRGKSALECWYSADTHGVKLPCSQPEILEKVIRTKKSVNLQIKLWAEDIANGNLLTQSELWTWIPDYPEWVFKAVVEQAGKILKEKIGFIPRFARIELFKGLIWFPEMDSFDPEI